MAGRIKRRRAIFCFHEKQEVATAEKCWHQARAGRLCASQTVEALT